MAPENSTLVEGVNGCYSMYVDNADSIISGVLSSTKVWEAGGTKIVKDNFTAGQTFVDAGAHFGYYSLLAASLGAKRVVAFEPFKRNFEFLKANVELNGYHSVIEAHNAPLWDSHARMRMSKGDANTGDVTVHFDPLPDAPLDMVAEVLDELLEPNTVDFIKTDCQGADYKVLNGARRLLAQSEQLKLMVERQWNGAYGYSEADFWNLMRESRIREEKLIGEEGTYFLLKP